MVAFGSGFGWNPASGNTAAGSAGKQTAKEYPDLRTANGVSVPGWSFPARALVLVHPLDIGEMPTKIQSCERQDALQSFSTRPVRFQAINARFYAAHLICR